MKICIVGAGISGLATAKAILNKSPGTEVIVFEASDRVGGKVWTEKTEAGYLCEGGVNGFLDKVPQTLDLCQQVGIQALSADDAAKKRFVYSHGKLHKLPEKPLEFFTSGLLTVPGRLRVMYELFAGGTNNPDESLQEFATRRLGREAFERLIDPMASGVFAGDAEKLSLQSCFPRIHQVEAEYGSLIRGLIKLQRKARQQGNSKQPSPGPGGTLTSFTDGMSELTDALATQLGSRIKISSAIQSISRTTNRYQLQVSDGSEHECDTLILASPAYTQATMLAEFDTSLAELLMEIPYPALSVCCFGYQQRQVGKVLDGFGYLVPSTENRAVLGTLIDSNLFPGRAPDGAVLLRSIIGGARRPELALLPEPQLISQVQTDLHDILGLKAAPDFIRIFRHEKAIPQYVVGHAGHLTQIEEKLQAHPGLILTGNAFKGVSLNDCIVNAGKIAAALPI